MKKIVTLLLLIITSYLANSQITLSGTSYSENFDNAGSGLPAGFSVHTGATASALGTAQTFVTTATSWSTATGQFRNSASFDGLVSTSNSAAQSGSTDRVIGLRQAASFGDGSAAFVMQLSNTTGFSSFLMSFKLQSLDITSPRVATWLVDYGIGASPSSFSPITTLPATLTTGGASFTNTNVTLDFGTALDNINQPVWIRIVTLTPTTGSGTRATTGIDDLVLNYSNGAGCTAPSIQASGAAINNITSTSFDINWAPGNGTHSLVVVKAATVVAGTPVNGTSYTSNTNFGSGQTIAANEFVVYNATGNTVNVTGLSPGVTYHVAVFTFNSAGNCYNVTSPPLTNATTVCPQPTVQASNISITPGINFAIINWTAGNGNASLVKLNSVNSFTPPVDGIVYSANSTWSAGEQTIYAGTNNSVTVSGLTGSTTYYVSVYTFNSCASTPNYLQAGNIVQNFTTSNAGTYYSSISTETCSALKSALRGITAAGHVQLDYGDIDNDNHPVTDDRLNDAATQTIVWDIYSDNPAGPDPYELLFSQFNTGGAAEGQGWNKEHTFPNSWFSASSSTSNYPGSDLHQVLPTDIYINSQRGNLPYGIVASPNNTYLNGSKKGTSSIAFPGYSGDVFEPIDAYKGDVARIYFYMVTRYENDQATWEALEPTGDVVMDGLPYPSIELSYLKMLLNWNAADPVSAKEIDRNNDVFSFQGNRNPYVDHPEYVTKVWSQSCGLALPVDLIEFKVQPSGMLTWSIVRADGLDRFEIQRSVNGGPFIKIGDVRWIPGQNNYSYADDVALISGKVQYRLRMIDQNNVFKYSKVVMVNLPGFNSIALLFPNPAKNVLTFSFRKPASAGTVIYILDGAGKNVSRSTLNPGQITYQVNISNLASGMYLMKCIKNGEVSYAKFIVQK